MDKYIWWFGQIHLMIWTNTFDNLDKYTWQFGQLHFPIWWSGFLLSSCHIWSGLIMGRIADISWVQTWRGTFFLPSLFNLFFLVHNMWFNQLKKLLNLAQAGWVGVFDMPNSNRYNILRISIFFKISLSISILIFSKISLWYRCTLCSSPNLTIYWTRPRPTGPRWIVGRVKFSRVNFSRLASRVRRSARRGPDPTSVQKCKGVLIFDEKMRRSVIGARWALIVYWNSLKASVGKGEEQIFCSL